MPAKSRAGLQHAAYLREVRALGVYRQAQAATIFYQKRPNFLSKAITEQEKRVYC
jgi:hypothetical protein